jgi:hypothetical protein
MHRQTASMRVGGLWWIAGAVLASHLPAQVPTQPRCEVIQLRFVDDAPAPSARRYRERDTGVSYAVTDTVALDTRGIQDVAADPFVESGHDTVWTVLATVRPAMADGLSAITAKHIEQHAAVLIGDELVQSALIQGPVRSKLALRIHVSKAIADSLVLRVREAITPRCIDR